MNEQPISEPLNHEWLTLWQMSMTPDAAPWLILRRAEQRRPLWIFPIEYEDILDHEQR